MLRFACFNNELKFFFPRIRLLQTCWSSSMHAMLFVAASGYSIIDHWSFVKKADPPYQ